MEKICKKCGNKIPQSIKIDKLRHTLQNRLHCLDCVPFKTHRGKSKFLNLLSDAELELKENKKVTDKIKNKKKNSDKQKRFSHKTKKEKGDYPTNLLRKNRKQQILEALGNCCMLCGYMKLTKNLCFHHLHDKDFLLNITEFRRPIETILLEVKKCILICHNCHGEVHAGLIDEEVIKQKHEKVIEIMENFVGRHGLEP